MKVFKETIKRDRPRPNGRPGFQVLEKGRTPESYGLTTEEIAELETQLVEREGVSEDKVVEHIPIMDRIKVAIAHMLSDDPEKKKRKLWTAGGQPRVEAIEKIIDDSITEDQRNEAWANYEKEE